MNKPIIETMINTTALALTSFGVVEITKGVYYGFLCILFGMGLEFLKYLGRHKKFWK
jgi:hypothetical protein